MQDSLFVNPDNPAVAENPDYYKGRVIVLVDSSTQSQAEYTAMAFQATPRCTVSARKRQAPTATFRHS